MKLHRILAPILNWLGRLEPRIAPPSGLLIISAGGLGDTVLFSRVVSRYAGLAVEGERVTLLLRKDAASMGFLFAPQIQIKTVDYGRLRKIGYRLEMFRSLWAANYRMVVHSDFLRHPDLDEALAFATGAPIRMAMEPRPSPKHHARLQANRKRYTRVVDTGGVVQDKILRWVAFANALSGKSEPVPDLRLRISTDTPLRSIAVLQPFSAVTLKQSPPALWLRIIGALPADWDILLAGHPKDLERNPEFAALLECDRVRFEGAPFKDLAPILAASKLVVSVDTACVHLAVVMGARTVCLASAAYVGEIMPYAPQIAPDSMTVFYASCAHEGCLGSCVYTPVRGMYPCVADLDGDEIEAWVKTNV